MGRKSCESAASITCPGRSTYSVISLYSVSQQNHSEAQGLSVSKSLCQMVECRADCYTTAVPLILLTIHLPMDALKYGRMYRMITLKMKSSTLIGDRGSTHGSAPNGRFMPGPYVSCLPTGANRGSLLDMSSSQGRPRLICCNSTNCC